MRTYTPHTDRLIVRPDPAETVHRSGLEIPEWWRRAEPRGTVIFVGLNVALYDPELVPGAVVRYSEHTGSPLSITEDGERHELLILHREDLWAVELDGSYDAPAEAEAAAVA